MTKKSIKFVEFFILFVPFHYCTRRKLVFTYTFVNKHKELVKHALLFVSSTVYSLMQVMKSASKSTRQSLHNLG